MIIKALPNKGYHSQFVLKFSHYAQPCGEWNILCVSIMKIWTKNKENISSHMEKFNYISVNWQMKSDAVSPMGRRPNVTDPTFLTPTTQQFLLAVICGLAVILQFNQQWCFVNIHYDPNLPSIKRLNIQIIRKCDKNMMDSWFELLES